MDDSLKISIMLNQAIQAACPGASYRIGSATDQTTWTLYPPATATSAQIAAGNTALQGFDPTTAAKAYDQQQALKPTLQDVINAMPLAQQQTLQTNLQTQSAAVTA